LKEEKDKLARQCQVNEIQAQQKIKIPRERNAESVKPDDLAVEGCAQSKATVQNACS
jgi:hypothetical protein